MRFNFARLLNQSDPTGAKRRFRLAFIIGLTAVVAFDGSWTVAQELEQLRAGVRQPSPRKTADTAPPVRERKQRDCPDDDDDDDDNSLESFLGSIVFAIAVSPFCLPRSSIDDDSFEPGQFERYPFYNCNPGLMRVDRDDCDGPDPLISTESYDWLVRFRTEHTETFDDLSRTGGQLLWDTSSRWGIDSQFDNLRESRNGQPDDSLWNGDANLVYRFAQSPRVQMRTGIGFNWLKDDTQTDFGFNFTYGGDFFIKNPWVLSSEIDWGRLGHAQLFRGRVTTGITWHRCEFYTGYEFLEIGPMQINGLVAGIRLWQSGRLPSF